MTMGGEKRPLDRDASKDGMFDNKRQRSQPASIIVEAVKKDSLQKLCSSLEPMLRRVVAEEVERAFAKFAPPKLGTRLSPERIPSLDQTNLRLEFRNKLALPLFTGSKVEGEQGLAINIVLLHAGTGQVVTTGPEACAKLDIVVLEGDFTAEDEDSWTREEFENFEVRERDGKRPLLTGDLTVTLKDGVGTLGELTFTDNSSWIRSRKFRLGVKVAPEFGEGLRIREAKTEAFTVKDHRGELYKKHYPPALNDEVWRLDKIGKDGAFHKRLNQSRIMTVEDFLRLVVMDPLKLRNILGNGMSNKIWEGTVEHAKSCVLSGKLHVYYADEKQNIGVIFNNIFQLMGLIADGAYMSVDSLSDSEKVYVDKLVKVAFENWENVVEYDGEALVGVTTLHQGQGFDTRTEDPLGERKVLSRSNVSNIHSQGSAGSGSGSRSESLSYGQEPTNIAPGSFPDPIGQLPDNHSITGPVLQMNSSTETHHQPVLPNSPEESLLAGHTGLTGLALGPPQSSTTASSSGMNTLDPATMNASTSGTRGWRRRQQQEEEEEEEEEQRQQQQQSRLNLQRQESLDRIFPNEDEIRSQSLELFESEDMQTQIHQLLRLYNGQMGGVPFSPYGPTIEESFPLFGFPVASEEAVDEHKPRPNGKAYVGWLKLKAVLHWTFFVRKQAAARRAQLEEADEPES